MSYNQLFSPKKISDFFIPSVVVLGSYPSLQAQSMPKAVSQVDNHRQLYDSWHADTKNKGEIILKLQQIMAYNQLFSPKKISDLWGVASKCNTHTLQPAAANLCIYIYIYIYIYIFLNILFRLAKHRYIYTPVFFESPV